MNFVGVKKVLSLQHKVCDVMGAKYYYKLPNLYYLEVPQNEGNVSVSSVLKCCV